jgi:hypothetical protein
VAELTALHQQQREWVGRVLGLAFPGAASTDAPAAGIVAKRGFLVARWTQMQAQLAAELDALCAAIAKTIPCEQPDAIKAGVRRALTPVLDTMRDSIGTAVDKSVSAGDGKYAAVAKAVASCRTACAGNELIAALRDNTLTDGSKFEIAIGAALAELETRLTA